MQVHAEILVNQLVAHSGNLLPGDLRPAGLRHFGQILHRLADHFQIEHHGILDYRAGKKCISTLGCVFSNPADCVSNVEQINPVGLHSGTASE